MNMFDTGKVEFPPKSELISILLKARAELRKSEDDWTLDDMCRVRDMFPIGFRNLDPSVISVRMRRLRKDKDVPKIKTPMVFVERFLKLLRDFQKNRERRGERSHSDDYIEYINSYEWADKAREHKERVNWRCQFCDCHSSKLEIHHTAEGYRNLRNEMPWHLIAVCRSPCHPLADMLREGLFQKSEDLANLGYCREEDIP